MKTKLLFFGATIFILAAGSVPLDAGQYFQDFSAFSVGATSFGDGSQFFSTALGTVAAVQDNTHLELQLTETGESGVTSAFELPDLDAGKPVYAFSVKWNSQVYGDFANAQAADGFSFNFGQLASLNLTNAAVEAGYGTGLCFSVETYPFGNPGFYLKVNGTNAASVSYNPNTEWGGFNAMRHFFEVDWNYINGMSVKMDGQAIFSNVAVANFTPHAGDVFVWAARCGSLSEEVRLDNIAVVTGVNLKPVTVGAPYYQDAAAELSASNAFDGDDLDAYDTAASSGYAGGTLASPTNILLYTILSQNNANRTYDPQQFSLQGSADGVTWDTNNPVSSGLFLHPLEKRAWLATNTAAYPVWRLNIFTNNGASQTELSEVQFYQPVPPPPPFGYSDNGNGTCTITNYIGYGGAVIIPDTLGGLTVTSIGNNAFESFSLISPTALTSVIIPNSVTNIGNEAFEYCNKLTSVTIGTNVTSIGDTAFLECGLTNVIIPDSVISIGADAFNRTKLASVTIGNSVISIGDYAFGNNQNLTSVTIPDSVISIGANAFGRCSILTNVTIGNGVTSIGTEAFFDCGLTSVTIPNSVTSIGDYAFLGCLSLTSVTIGSGVTNIGDYAFSDCTALTLVYFQGNAPTADSIIFDNDTTNNITVYYVPGTTGWANFASVVGVVTAPQFGSTTYAGLPVIFYPPAETDNTLQMSTNIASGNWITVSNAVALAAVQLTNPPPQAFFRLQSSDGSTPDAGLVLYANLPVLFYPTNAAYSPQMSTNLAAPNWSAPPGGNTFITVQITNAPPNAVFRLH